MRDHTDTDEAEAEPGRNAAAPGGGAGSDHLPSTMQAVRFHGGPDGLRVETIARPEPGPGEVLVRVAACGLCGSDAHFLDGMPVPSALPRVLGHEPAGFVVATGSAVDGWAAGDRVAVHVGAGCGTCRTCRSGAPEACPFQAAPGLHLDGAFADYLTVPSATLVRVPDGVSMEAAAVATDCVASPYHALACRARLRPGEQVVVIGVGGLGSMAVVLARLLGAARVVAVDVSPDALDRARALGADACVTVPPGGDTMAALGEVRAALDGAAEVVIECVGKPETAALGAWSLLPGGRLVLVGVGMEPPSMPIPQALFALGEYSVIGSFASHRHDLEAVLDLAATGVLDIDASISHRVSLDGVPAGYEQLRHYRDNPQRIVMVRP